MYALIFSTSCNGQPFTLFLDKESHLPEMLHDPKFSQNLHQNADSGRLFSELCQRELERRAFEEPDLMKVSFPYILPTCDFSYVFQRDEILQARAASCSLPRQKQTTPAKDSVRKSTVGKSLFKSVKQKPSRGVVKTPAKTTGHDKGGKLTAHPDPRGAKTPANARKSTGGKSPSKGGKQTPSRGVVKTRAKATANGGKVNGGAKNRAAAAIKTASKKSPPSHAKVAKPAVKAMRK